MTRLDREAIALLKRRQQELIADWAHAQTDEGRRAIRFAAQELQAEIDRISGAIGADTPTTPTTRV